MLVSTVIPGLAACGQSASGQVIRSDKGRDSSPAVDEADLAKLIAGNNAFAFNLYHVLRQKKTNLFYSPYSIYEVLAMTYAGARSETERDITEALNFVLSQEHLHPAFNSLDCQLKERGVGGKGKDNEGFRLHMVNAICGQKGYRFLGEFLDVLAQNYGAGLRILDLINETEQSRLIINKWVSDQTEGKIKDLVPEGTINHLTRLVVTNAAYFNAAWQHPFKEDATSDGLFHLLGNSSVTVSMMKQTEFFLYKESDNYEVLELPYDGQELSMVILLPKAGQFNAFEEKLNAEFVKVTIGNLEAREVALTMPRFEYESGFGLKEALKTLGMVEAFITDADFSGMNGKRDIFIKEVLHKASVSVDEAGTEATAASAEILDLISLPQEPVAVTLDRPFIFLIRDIPTGCILFVGQVLNPVAK